VRTSRPWLINVGLLSLLLGMLIAASVRTQMASREQGNIPKSRTAQVLLVEDLERQIRDYAGEIRELRSKITDYEESASSQRRSSALINGELQDLKLKAGLTDVAGPGLLITLRDSPRAPFGSPGEWHPGLVHDSDIRGIVNELWIAGAEAISVGGQRLVGWTGIRCVGNVIQVNGQSVKAPYEIKAIGDADVLDSALNMPGGILDGPDGLRELGMVEIEKKQELRVQAYSGPTRAQYVKPYIPDETGEGGAR
jgi:uncharacterized protein YlxW (UPF0749 family)